VSPEGCYVTLLRRPETGVLAFVTNLSREAQTVTARFDLDRLGLRDRPLDVLNALTDEPVSLSGAGEVSLSLGSEEWAYIWLRPRAADGGQ